MLANASGNHSKQLEDSELLFWGQDGPTGYQKLEIQITADSGGFSKKIPICGLDKGRALPNHSN